jgi:hypothetical protein
VNISCSPQSIPQPRTFLQTHINCLKMHSKYLATRCFTTLVYSPFPMRERRLQS